MNNQVEDPSTNPFDGAAVGISGASGCLSGVSGCLPGASGGLSGASSVNIWEDGGAGGSLGAVNMTATWPGLFIFNTSVLEIFAFCSIFVMTYLVKK